MIDASFGNRSCLGLISSFHRVALHHVVVLLCLWHTMPCRAILLRQQDTETGQWVSAHDYSNLTDEARGALRRVKVVRKTPFL
jgi:hypothetical protein